MGKRGRTPHRRDGCGFRSRARARASCARSWRWLRSFVRRGGAWRIGARQVADDTERRESGKGESCNRHRTSALRFNRRAQSRVGAMRDFFARLRGVLERGDGRHCGEPGLGRIDKREHEQQRRHPARDRRQPCRSLSRGMWQRCRNNGMPPVRARKRCVPRGLRALHRRSDVLRVRAVQPEL